jgi:AmmeMemoRadiSam system protein B
MERKARVAGRFYEQEPDSLLAELEHLWPKPLPPVVPCIGAMVPHAGYMYSGKVAAQVYARLPQADVYVLLGPNHTGHGAPVAVATAGHWETPLGAVPIYLPLAQALLKHCPLAQWDDQAHRDEHSLEVQLPFLQKSGHEFSIVCVAISTWDMGVLTKVGQALAQAISSMREKVCILASSDMNHFENLEITQRLDHMALERMEALDPQGLINVVTQEDISMCGAGPMAALLVAAMELGAVQCKCVAYATSAEASGDTDRVVGYAGMLVR